MHIHTNVIDSWEAISHALTEQKRLGRVALHVSFKVLRKHRSNSRAHAFEVQLEARERDNGRRAGNSGSYGAMRPEFDGYAATFDEWGWLLAALYRLDGDMIVGSAKTPTYSNLVEFHRKTAWTYLPEALIDALENGDDPYPIVNGRAVNTKRGYVNGRRGANRVSDQPAHWPGKVQHRTIDEVRKFAYPLESNSIMVWFASATDGSPLAATYVLEHWTRTVGSAVAAGILTYTFAEETLARFALSLLLAKHRFVA